MRGPASHKLAMKARSRWERLHVRELVGHEDVGHEAAQDALVRGKCLVAVCGLARHERAEEAFQVFARRVRKIFAEVVRHDAERTDRSDEAHLAADLTKQARVAEGADERLVARRCGAAREIRECQVVLALEVVDVQSHLRPPPFAELFERRRTPEGFELTYESPYPTVIHQFTASRRLRFANTSGDAQRLFSSCA